MRSRFLPALSLLLAVSASGCGYNTIQTLDERAEQAKNQIGVQLQRRADLVPNLVSTVKGYAAHEEAVFTNVANARAGLAGAVQRGNPAEMAQANEQLTGALGRLLVISEAYPQLKADQSFLRLQDELTGTENRIAVARTDYNEIAGQYNQYIRRFPGVVTAKVTGAKQREYFEVTNPASLDAPTVDFSKTPGKTP
jgi:LemA protein